MGTGINSITLSKVRCAGLSRVCELAGIQKKWNQKEVFCNIYYYIDYKIRQRRYAGKPGVCSLGGRVEGPISKVRSTVFA